MTDTVPNGTYAVPVQITDTKTGKAAITQITVVKDGKSVKIEQLTTVTDVLKESSTVENKELNPSTPPNTHTDSSISVTEKPSQTANSSVNNSEESTVEETSPSAQTTNMVRKVLASTGASLELLALVSLILSGIGVAVLMRRKDR